MVPLSRVLKGKPVKIRHGRATVTGRSYLLFLEAENRDGKTKNSVAARSQKTCLGLDLVHFADRGTGRCNFEPGRDAGLFCFRGLEHEEGECCVKFLRIANPALPRLC